MSEVDQNGHEDSGTMLTFKWTKTKRLVDLSRLSSVSALHSTPIFRTVLVRLCAPAVRIGAAAPLEPASGHLRRTIMAQLSERMTHDLEDALVGRPLGEFSVQGCSRDF